MRNWFFQRTINGGTWMFGWRLGWTRVAGRIQFAIYLRPHHRGRFNYWTFGFGKRGN